MFVRSAVLSQSCYWKKERQDKEDVTINNFMLQRPIWEANTGSSIENRTQTHGRFNRLTFTDVCNISNIPQ